MALTTHERIRKLSGFQSMFIRSSFRNSPDGSATAFYVDSDDNVKIVPEFGTGTTVAGISDVQVWLGLSGVYGVSQLGVSAIDIDQGSIRLVIAPPSGCSLTVSYSSSAIASKDIESARKEAEANVNQRLSLCYDLPLSPTPASVESMAARLAAALLLIRGYGTGARDTSEDGYRLYQQLMGDNQRTLGNNSNGQLAEVGEIGLICSPNYQLVDEDGNVIPRNDDDSIVGNNTFVSGGRTRGRIFDVTEEPFRFKPFQDDVNQEQPGSGIN